MTATGGGWVTDNRRQVVDAFRAAAVPALQSAGEHLLEEANRTVPIEEATLLRSGTVSIDSDRRRSKSLLAAVAYDTPYAVRQHEDTRLRHDEGRRAKWLQLALQEQAATLKAFLGAAMKARLH